jgi:hypothetical protein
MFNNFFLENRTVYEIMWKIFRVGQATDDNMAHARCVFDAKGYKQTHRIRNAY